MRELSLNILDIAMNSVKAQATKIDIEVDVDTTKNNLSIAIFDNGCGMKADMLARVCDPFTTTRTTRKVGLGIPLFKQSAEDTGGSFEITSQEGVGTVVKASYVLDSIDRMPLGDVPSTLITLLQCAPYIDYTYAFTYDGKKFVFSTEKIKSVLGDVDICESEILAYITDYLNDNLQNVHKGDI